MSQSISTAPSPSVTSSSGVAAISQQALSALQQRFLHSEDNADLPIVDAHMHFWDPQHNYHPWLCDLPRIPFRYGDYSAICQPYLPADYQRQQGQHRVVGSIYMEAEWDPTDPLGEARWISELHQRSGWPLAMIGQAWLDRDDCAGQLAGLAAWPLVRGVRHKPRTLAQQDYRPDHRLPGSMQCERWQRGYALLQEYNLLCELQCPWWHLPDAVPLLQRYPGVTLVINHTGVPGDRSPATLTGWQQAMSQLAAFPQVSVKISGLGLPQQPWRLEDNQWLIRQTIELFGAERCLFASNFPVDGLVTSLDALFGHFKQATADLPAAERLALFCTNALRLYRVHLPDATAAPG
ncbi:thioesterase [Pokkaliibacter plantistimulans]|uniref:Thioesterase n=1 Tax=Proteobacteria bacterium 228 TaxID=2083153 RepID=A0A2S5KLM8_9PROT|nr:amidohydrolase family protein [Pokkaliibacter plantistimulans]PPC75553.1 thioesterase [Pokkaliibacter plantistimulans]